MKDYFSDRERGGPRNPSTEEISPAAWGGIYSAIERRLEDGSFGRSFPVTCQDGAGVTGADRESFFLLLEAEIPDLWSETGFSNRGPVFHPRRVPDQLAVLDLLEFCHAHVAEPSRRQHHKFYDHDHLDFDIQRGRAAFRGEINRILSRNGIAFEIGDGGEVHRLLPPEADAHVLSGQFDTGDETLNQLLDDARSAFMNPSSGRRLAVERLWDGWERLKSLEDAKKQRSIKKLLDAAAVGDPDFRQLLEDEATHLTRVGNNYNIRHHELEVTLIKEEAHLEYLFFRLFSLIHLILATTGRVADDDVD